jgi:NitT/TauT family transport system permease protein
VSTTAFPEVPLDVDDFEDDFEADDFDYVPTRFAKMRPRLLSIGTTALVLVCTIAIWQIICVSFHVSGVIFPSASLTWHSLSAGLSDFGPSGFWVNGRTTVLEIVLGFIGGMIAGVIAGIALAKSVVIERIAYPYIAMFNALPKVAIAPLFVLWLGFGIISKVVLSITVSFFPIMVAIVSGMKSIDPDLSDLFTNLGASRWQRFRQLEIPGSLPFLFGGLEIAVIYSIISAIVGEFIGAQSGLGLQLLNADNNLQTSEVFAILVILGLMGLVATYALRLLQRKLLFWSGPARSQNQALRP